MFNVLLCSGLGKLKCITISLISNVLNPNGKVLEETLAGSYSNAMKTTLRRLSNFRTSFSFLKVLEKPLAILSGFSTSSREYYKWLSRLRCHIQVGRLPVSWALGQT